MRWCLDGHVLDDLEAAARAYQDAQAAVVDVQRQVAENRANVPHARERLAEAIVAAALVGVRLRDIVKVTGCSREQVRRILRAGGVEPPTDD
jgi:hypothetical protein